MMPWHHNDAMTPQWQHMYYEVIGVSLTFHAAELFMIGHGLIPRLTEHRAGNETGLDQNTKHLTSAN